MSRAVKWMILNALSAAVLAVAVLAGSWEAAAAGLLQEIQGNWTIASAVNEKEGKKTDVFGDNPMGSLILTPEGGFRSS